MSSETLYYYENLVGSYQYATATFSPNNPIDFDSTSETMVVSTNVTPGSTPLNAVLVSDDISKPNLQLNGTSINKNVAVSDGLYYVTFFGTFVQQDNLTCYIQVKYANSDTIYPLLGCSTFSQIDSTGGGSVNNSYLFSSISAIVLLAAGDEVQIGQYSNANAECNTRQYIYDQNNTSGISTNCSLIMFKIPVDKTFLYNYNLITASGSYTQPNNPPSGGSSGTGYGYQAPNQGEYYYCNNLNPTNGVFTVITEDADFIENGLAHVSYSFTENKTPFIDIIPYYDETSGNYDNYIVEKKFETLTLNDGKTLLSTRVFLCSFSVSLLNVGYEYTVGNTYLGFSTPYSPYYFMCGLTVNSSSDPSDAVLLPQSLFSNAITTGSSWTSIQNLVGTFLVKLKQDDIIGIINTTDTNPTSSTTSATTNQANISDVYFSISQPIQTILYNNITLNLIQLNSASEFFNVYTSYKSSESLVNFTPLPLYSNPLGYQTDGIYTTEGAPTNIVISDKIVIPSSINPVCNYLYHIKPGKSTFIIYYSATVTEPNSNNEYNLSFNPSIGLLINSIFYSNETYSPSVVPNSVYYQNIQYIPNNNYQINGQCIVTLDQYSLLSLFLFTNGYNGTGTYDETNSNGVNMQTVIGAVIPSGSGNPESTSCTVSMTGIETSFVPYEPSNDFYWLTISQNPIVPTTTSGTGSDKEYTYNFNISGNFPGETSNYTFEVNGVEAIISFTNQNLMTVSITMLAPPSTPYECFMYYSGIQIGVPLYIIFLEQSLSAQQTYPAILNNGNIINSDSTFYRTIPLYANSLGQLSNAGGQTTPLVTFEFNPFELNSQKILEYTISSTNSYLSYSGLSGNFTIPLGPYSGSEPNSIYIGENLISVYGQLIQQENISSNILTTYAGQILRVNLYFEINYSPIGSSPTIQYPLWTTYTYESGDSVVEYIANMEFVLIFPPASALN